MVKKKKRVNNTPFDDFFRRILQNKKIVEELLRVLVNKSWVNELDFSTLTTDKDTYISKKNKKTADDMVWKIKYNDNIIHIVIMLEVQSVNDNRMPFRFLDYIGSYYENQFKSVKKDEKLPPIIPILLYVGEKNWNAKVKFHDLIFIPDKRLKKYIPNFSYIPIIIDKMSKKRLSEAESVLARLLSLNKSKNKDEFKKLSQNLFKYIKIKNTDEQKEYLEYFMSYIHLVLKAPISKKEAQEIADEVVEEEMFFVTMEHLFEDDRKKDKEALEKAEKRAEKALKREEKERKKAEKERNSKIKAILKLYKKGFSIEELAEDFEMKIEEIKKIVE
jgi:predicted transposase/invertase (TIGR01784 family)